MKQFNVKNLFLTQACLHVFHHKYLYILHLTSYISTLTLLKWFYQSQCQTQPPMHAFEAKSILACVFARLDSGEGNREMVEKEVLDVQAPEQGTLYFKT